MSHQQWTVPPPSYEPGHVAKKDSTEYGTEPLLASQGTSRAPQWDEEAAFPESPDFKPHVAQASAEIRHAFIRKVYSTLFVQLLGSVVVGALLRNDSSRAWVMQNGWSIWLSLAGTFVSLFACQWKAQSYPTNYALLGVFTLFESFMVGTAVSFYDQALVLQALLITLFVFMGLTLFTLQSKYDFSSLGPWLMTGLFAVMGVIILNFFIPFGRVEDAVLSGIVVLLFCGFILFDTHSIMHRLSPDDHILASISLYLDVINLFLWILRLLNDVRHD